MQQSTILSVSPHDLNDNGQVDIETETAPKLTRWVPSRFNVRAKADNGQMVLWNTLTRAMSAFDPSDAPKVRDMLARKGFEGKEEGFTAYLAKRGYLVKEGADELRRFEAMFGHQHYRSNSLHLILLASEDCNFRCQYCYEKFARGTMRPEVRKAVKKMVTDRIDSLDSLLVSWFGGEPLYGYPAVKDLAPFFKETADEHDLHFVGNMTTNGYLLTPEKADALLSWGVNMFQITLDGPPESHNCSRPARDGSETFETIYNNLKSMAKRKDDFTIRIRVNFDRNNHSKMEPFLDLIQKGMGGDSRFHLAFHGVGKWGGDNDENLEVCGTRGERALIKSELKREAKKRGLNILTIKDFNQFGRQACYAARPYSFLIGATGKIMKCTIALDTADHNIVGHFDKEGKMVLDPDKMALWTEPAFQRDSQCQKCAVLPACQGIHCPLIRIEENRQPCITTRFNPKGELLEAFNLSDASRQISVV